MEGRSTQRRQGLSLMRTLRYAVTMSQAVLGRRASDLTSHTAQIHLATPGALLFAAPFRRVRRRRASCVLNVVDEGTTFTLAFNCG